MKRIVPLLLLLAVGLAMVGAQSAAATVPTISGFAPASGPPDWSVTLTGTGFSAATTVTFTPADTTYAPVEATFTVEDDTTIVATVPFLGLVPLGATLTVESPDGPATSASDFSVDGRAGLSKHRGVSGEAITLSGSGFTAATQVIFGTWRAGLLGDEDFLLANPVGAHFRVLKDTQVAATVPALRAGRQYWVAVVSPASTSVTDHAAPLLVVVTPRLLSADFGNSFAIRPATVTPSGDGTFEIGNLGTQHGHDIRWRVWSASKAYGTGTVWIDNGIPNAAQGTFHGYRGSISASRVRGGRFTRMTVRWQQNGRTHRQALKLTHALVGSGWFWN